MYAKPNVLSRYTVRSHIHSNVYLVYKFSLMLVRIKFPKLVFGEIMKYFIQNNIYIYIMATLEGFK